MLSIFLLFLSLLSGLYAQTAERPLKVVVEAGRNVTLPHLSGSHQTGQSFNHTYPFNELCDYPTSQSQHSLTHTVSTVIFLGIIGFSILIIIAAFIYLCWHRKSLCVSKTEPLMPIPY
ncbi:membrane glycoprotein E3 CR1-beta [Human adenovirus 12]|uniref:Membrane glycoprotein E3 CR1-beta n=1 Tax=Human adenovirus A serotype 12 TaxID=28282 RepID=A0A3G8WBQ3_ADE12|nr:membrane glycoprotein E3 CR1-beta [Human adenovirus 12]